MACASSISEVQPITNGDPGVPPARDPVPASFSPEASKESPEPEEMGGRAGVAPREALEEKRCCQPSPPLGLEARKDGCVLDQTAGLSPQLSGSWALCSSLHPIFPARGGGWGAQRRGRLLSACPCCPFCSLSSLRASSQALHGRQGRGGKTPSSLCPPPQSCSYSFSAMLPPALPDATECHPPALMASSSPLWTKRIWKMAISLSRGQLLGSGGESRCSRGL